MVPEKDRWSIQPPEKPVNILRRAKKEKIERVTGVYELHNPDQAVANDVEPGVLRGTI